MLVLYRCKYNHFLKIIKLLIIKLLIKSFFSHREYYLCHADYADPADFSSPNDEYYMSRWNSGNGRNGLRPAMRHGYPHAEAQRALSSHRYFISNTDLPDSTDWWWEVTDPTPRCAHPSPTMGGELVTTKMLDHNTVLAPPRHRASAPPKYRWLFRLPTPLRGGVLARGAGCKITAIKQVVPNVGTLYSHVGNIWELM